MADAPATPPRDGLPEAGSFKAGLPEAGSPEAGSPEAGSPEAGSPEGSPAAAASPRAPSSSSSPTFDVRPIPSTQARWPGEVRRGSVTLLGGGASLAAGVVLLALGPMTQVPSFFLAGLFGLLLGAFVLVIGIIQYLKRGYAAPSMKRWQAAVFGAAVPIGLGLLLAGLEVSGG